LRDTTPAISVRFAEPPSVEGTGGAQIGEGGAGADAVALAACVEVSGISPRRSKGDWGLVVAAAFIAPGPPMANPVVVVDPLEAPEPDPDDGDDADPSEDVDTPSRSDPTLPIVGLDEEVDGGGEVGIARVSDAIALSLPLV
jgi:hypothetical protein